MRPFLLFRGPVETVSGYGSVKKKNHRKNEIKNIIIKINRK